MCICILYICQYKPHKVSVKHDFLQEIIGQITILFVNRKYFTITYIDDMTAPTDKKLCLFFSKIHQTIEHIVHK